MSDEAGASKPILSRPFLALLFVSMAFNVAVSIFHLLPKFMAQELGAGATEIGALVSTFGVVMIASVPLVGSMLDGSRHRRVLRLGCALMVAASLGFFWVDRLGPLLFVLRGLQALSLSLCINAGSAITAVLAPPARLAQALGLYTSAGMLMNALGPALAEYVAERGSYAPVFAIAAGSSALAWLLSLRMARIAPEGGRRVSTSLQTLLRRPNALRMIAILSVTGVGFGAMFSLSQPFALSLGMPNVRGFFMSFTLGAVLVRVLGGSRMDRLGHRRVAAISLAGYGVAVLAMAFLAEGRLELLGGLFGVTHGLFMPAFTALVVTGAAAQDRGMLLTLFTGAFNLGNCLVLWLGVCAEQFGYRGVFAATGVVILGMPLLLRSWPAAALRISPAPRGARSQDVPAGARNTRRARRTAGA